MPDVNREQKIEFNSRERFLIHYLKEAPLALALERVLECYLLSTKEFLRPALDIGCGDGIFTKVLFKGDVDVGVDPDEMELGRANACGKYRELIVCGGDKIPKRDKYFKTIFSNSVLEHIPIIADVLREANRLLADNGKMYITVPTNYFERYTVIYQGLSMIGLTRPALSFGRFYNRFWKHRHCYDKEGWSQLFKGCGFLISDCREYNPKWSCLLNDCLVPLSFISFLCRKYLKRWFLIPSVRKIIAPILAGIFRLWVIRNEKCLSPGGLIFFELQKQEHL